MRWENPPESPRKRNSGGKVRAHDAAQLRHNPGHWGMLDEFPVENRSDATNLAWQIRHGRLVAFRPEGAFDAVSRTEGNLVKVYARFLKEEE
jgi:hypothetical protein